MVPRPRIRAIHMKRIGIVAALHEELKPLVKDWRREGQVYTGRINGVECVAVSAGMGARSAENACAVAFSNGPLDALASIGWAGSLSCGLKPPGAFVISEVMDGETGRLYPTASTGGQRLVTLDHVARHDEKRKIAERYQAPLVDMEAATVARVACEKGAAFYCF